MKRKRLKSIILSALICIAFCCPFFVCGGNYVNAASGKNVYAAFGDSIAAGYALDGYSDGQKTAPKESYQALVGRFLKTDSHNYAVTGDDSNDCIEILNSEVADEHLAKADVITLSIGSNDLLLPFIYRLMKELEIDPGSIDPANPMAGIDITSISKYYQKLKQLLLEFENDAQFHAQTAAFPEKLDTILSMLKEKAPNARIYVTNLYNPFLCVQGLGETADIYIKEMNEAFDADAEDYTLIDVYSPFKEDPSCTNFRMDLSSLTGADINVDPHPSVKGHKTIASLITEAIKRDHAPKAATISNLKSSGKYKLSMKIKLDQNADKCQLIYATSKNGAYKKLAETSKKTFRTNTKKLKSKKTYYIKARSIKKLNGVIYYGKDSKASKLTVK